MIASHPVFSRFKPYDGPIPEGCAANFLGVMTRLAYSSDPYLPVEGQTVGPVRYPSIGEDYLEWIDVLEAVAESKSNFTMLELGAGWGRWTVNAAFARRVMADGHGTESFTAVEAEPTHFAWIVDHLLKNGLDPRSGSFNLVNAAVLDADGTTGFRTGGQQGPEGPEGDPADWYGQCVGGPTTVRSVSLRTLLEPRGPVDLIDLDVQGAELLILEAAAAEVDRKVKRVHIGTHSTEIEVGLRRLFSGLGWWSTFDFPLLSVQETAWGEVSFRDGVQAWVNPKETKA